MLRLRGCAAPPQHRGNNPSHGEPLAKCAQLDGHYPAKSVFHFDVQDAVAKSTHAGLPWLRYIRQRLPGRVHFWPFDGWTPPEGRSVIAEVYPALWSRGFPQDGRTPDQHDAWSVAEWMRRADLDGTLAEFFTPKLPVAERATAEIEGWILGLR